MNDVFRSLAVHQAHFHKALLTNALSEERASLLREGLIYDGLWLTKFPLLHTPGYGVAALDAWNKAAETGVIDAEAAKTLRLAVDADLVRFVLKLKPEDLEGKVELFFGGRAMNKPLWNYLISWFEHGAVLRARLVPGPGLLETVFS